MAVIFKKGLSIKSLIVMRFTLFLKKKIYIKSVHISFYTYVCAPTFIVMVPYSTDIVRSCDISLKKYADSNKLIKKKH